MTILARLREPSTWAALAAAFGALSAGAPAAAQTYLWGGTAVCTLLGILMGENSKPGER